MKNADIRQIALLCELIECQSLNEAARRLGITASAASQSLSRVKGAFHSDVYVRQGGEYALTAYGTEVIDGLRKVVQLWTDTQQQARFFDPCSCDTHFSLACTDGMFTPDLVAFHARFSKEAPGARLNMVSPYQNGQDIQSLRAGTVDLYCASLPAPCDAKDLHDELVRTVAPTHVLLSIDHPRIGDSISLDQYLSEEHLVAYYRNTDPAHLSPLDRKLMALGLAPRRSTFVQSMWTCFDMVASSDRLAFMPARVAEALTRRLALRALPAPEGLPFVEREIHMIWHQRTHRSRPHRWLRDRLRAAIRDDESTCAQGTVPDLGRVEGQP